MNNVAKLKPDAEDRDPLAKMREPFPANQVSKLPKPTKAQTEEVRNDFKKGVRCQACGAWHHPQVVHLDYVGHAALTDRLLDTDPHWSWEPVAFREGLPAFDATGGLWIKLTVCGVTRLGYGHAAAKPTQDPGSREKEVIGDALRNAAMRFGAALDLWHKGDLHADEPNGNGEPETTPKQSEAATVAIAMLNDAKTAAAFKALWEKNRAGWKEGLEPHDYARVVQTMKSVGIVWAQRQPEPEPQSLAGDPFTDDDLSVMNRGSPADALGDDTVPF